jgi:nicotinamide-nucleotide amidase
MIAEVISIGDELTSGQRLDTNSKWLSERLGELGVTVKYHTTVADDLDANVQVFRNAADRADIVVATGGLGPTADDLTREALAKVAGVELAIDEGSLEHIRGLFARHNREMPERNRVQAFFPNGSRPIFNPKGTAPGIAMPIPRAAGGVAHVFALPGVPAEMFEMFAQSVAPAVAAMLPERRVLRHRRIKCFGLGESQVEQMLPDLIRRGREPQVGITVHAATITLRITAGGESEAECEELIRPTVETIRSALGTLVFGEEEDELPDVVARLLATRGERLATIDAGTGGALEAALREFSGYENIYAGGMSLVDPAKQQFIWKAESQPAAESGRELVVAMAESIRRRFGVEYGVAVGAFPSDGGKDQPAAPYWYAVATAEKTLIRSATLMSHQSIWQPRAAKQALNLLRLWLLGHAEEGPHSPKR